METLLKHHGNAMETPWKCYGNTMETLWEHHGNAMETPLKRFGNTYTQTEKVRCSPAIRTNNLDKFVFSSQRNNNNRN